MANYLNSNSNMSCKKLNSFILLSLLHFFMVFKFGDLLSLRHFYWACIKIFLVNMPSRSIMAKRIIPYFIILVEFYACHMVALIVFNFIKILNRIHHMISIIPNSKRYPLLVWTPQTLKPKTLKPFMSTPKIQVVQF